MFTPTACRVFFVIGVTVTAALHTHAAQRPAMLNEQREYVPLPAPVQPLPFSHKLHAAQKVDCGGCHQPQTPDGEKETLPETDMCMTCHANTRREGSLRDLLVAHEKREPIAWTRVYSVPIYVVFSHKVHLDSAPVRITCEVCHGDVRELDAMRKLKDVSMPSCVDCHKQTGASTACTGVCHGELG